MTDSVRLLRRPCDRQSTLAEQTNAKIILYKLQKMQFILTTDTCNPSDT